MPDAARIAQAQALEIPVTVQGAKAADEAGRRELFTESAKTTLIFENGAVLNLRTRVTRGQSVFLRNDISQKEILCRVLEAPPDGEVGYTDLEFTETEPGFWEDHAEEPEVAEDKPEAAAERSETQTAAEKPGSAAAEPEPAAEKPAAPAHQETEAAADNSLAMMGANASELKLPPARVPELDPPLPPAPAPAPEEKPKGRLREELVPAHEIVPETPPPPATTEPTGEQIDAALRAMASAPLPPISEEGVDTPAHPHNAADPSDAKDEANLAALMAREARLAKRAALKERAAAEIGRRPAAPKAPKSAEGAEKAEGAEGAEGTGEASEEEAGPPKVPLIERLTTGKNLIVSEVVVGVAIVVAFGFIWHAVGPLFIHQTEEPVAAAAPPARKAAPPKAPLPVMVQKPAAPVAKVSAARPVVVSSSPVAKIVRPREAPSESAAAETGPHVVAPEVVASGPHVVEPEPVAEQPKAAEPVAPKPPENIPAKIITGPQPPFPPWAKNLDVSGVVKLDAVIDENGNLGATKIVSGPRLLRHAAEDAVQLWIFEPAQSDGKPTASHMILTVEFQR